jgi:hypothetical protein
MNPMALSINFLFSIRSSPFCASILASDTAFVLAVIMDLHDVISGADNKNGASA